MTSRAAPISARSCPAGSGSSTWGSISEQPHGRRAPIFRAQGRVVPIRHLLALALAALGALAAAFAASPARAGSAYSPEGTPPDSAVATLRVETLPPGLTVLVDGVRVGRSPVGPLWVPSKPVQVQAFSDDPRRFEATRDTVLLNPKPGQALVATIDLRPSVL